MTNFALQDFLFESQPTRRKLLDYASTLQKDATVQVFRNHSFELVENTISAYLDYAGIGIKFEYSGYDDSLSFTELDENADAIILWIDFHRYNLADSINFITGRIQSLRELFSRPILLVPFGKKVELDENLATVFSLDEIEKELGERFVDERMAKVTGTSLSNAAMLSVSRELGLKYIPAMIRPAKKAVILDFDNTLYSGVLGEDGPDGIVVTEGHKKLQEVIKKLADKGIFICGASKNELVDVVELLKNHKDFVLRESDFTKLCVSWQPKSTSIEEISKYLNIGIDSMVMVDDNIGELNALLMHHPDLNLIHAKDDGEKTAEILQNYPGLSLIKAGLDSAKRKNDVIANEKRRNLQNQVKSKEEYIRSLGIKLEFDRRNADKLMRISELSNKTNQFIFNYKRYTLAQVEQMQSSDEYAMVTVSLEDVLSNSGLIAVCVGKRTEDYVLVEEVFMSCRALGRGIDDVIIMGAIKILTEELKAKKVMVQFKDGDRNRPAREYLDNYLSDYVDNPKNYEFDFPKDLIDISIV